MTDTKQAAILKAMAHPIRLRILRLLLSGPSCATRANRILPEISQPNLSQHLKALRDNGLVDCAAVGVRRCYFLCRPTLVATCLKALAQNHAPRRLSPQKLATFARAAQAGADGHKRGASHE
jgi:ArsR family transcriptional regulator, arsenate/arsenite/antimonite-responsive transcriptional repressor